MSWNDDARTSSVVVGELAEQFTRPRSWVAKKRGQYRAAADAGIACAALRTDQSPTEMYLHFGDAFRQGGDIEQWFLFGAVLYRHRGSVTAAIRDFFDNHTDRDPLEAVNDASDEDVAGYDVETLLSFFDIFTD